MTKSDHAVPVTGNRFIQTSVINIGKIGTIYTRFSLCFMSITILVLLYKLYFFGGCGQVILGLWM